MTGQCKAVQHSDQMVCKKCDLTWDVNDPHPPSCRDAADHRGEGLTGKTRYTLRQSWFRKPLIVLQVEIRTPANDGTVFFLAWRDAEVKDLGEIAP